jgi:hypothetical protein
MNKLVNLLIILLVLKYVVPFAFTQLPVEKTVLYFNLFAGLTIAIVQSIYNYSMVESKRKVMSMKEIFTDAGFKGLLVFTSYFVFLDLKQMYNFSFTSDFDEKSLTALFATFVITCFIFAKYLLMP